jgi:hypothetical protein
MPEGALVQAFILSYEEIGRPDFQCVEQRSINHIVRLF